MGTGTGHQSFLLGCWRLGACRRCIVEIWPVCSRLLSGLKTRAGARAGVKAGVGAGARAELELELVLVAAWYAAPCRRAESSARLRDGLRFWPAAGPMAWACGLALFLSLRFVHEA